MAFKELSETDQALLSNSDQLVRRAVLKCRGALAAMKSAVIDYRSVTSELTAKLDDGEKVPYIGQLIGAVDVSKEVTAQVIEQFETLIKDWDTAEAASLHAQLIGDINLDGSHGGSQ